MTFDAPPGKKLHAKVDSRTIGCVHFWFKSTWHGAIDVVDVCVDLVEAGVGVPCVVGPASGLKNFPLSDLVWLPPCVSLVLVGFVFGWVLVLVLCWVLFEWRLVLHRG